MALTVYGYVQLTGEGDGNLPALRHALKTYARAGDLFLASIYADLGTTGASIDRNGLAALVNRLWLSRGRTGVLIPAPSHLSYNATLRRIVEQRITDTGAAIVAMYDNGALPTGLRP